MIRWLGAFAIVAVVLGWVSAASANPTARLVYVRGEGADSCPDEAEMRKAVAARLGYDPFRPFATTTLTAEITKDKSTFRGRVRLVDEAGVERGARDLESRAADCRDLTTAMALSMSIAIDPLSMTRPPPSEAAVVAEPAERTPEPPVPEPPAPAPPPAKPEAPAPVPPPASPPPRFALGVAGHVAVGIAPSAAAGVRPSVEILAPRWSLGLEGRFDFAAGSASSEGGRTETSLAGGAVVPCLKIPLVWACGVVLLAQVQAESLQVTQPRSEGFFFFGAGLRLHGAVELPEDFRLRLGGDVLGHPTPFQLSVNGRPVHESSAVSAAFGIALVRMF